MPYLFSLYLKYHLSHRRSIFVVNKQNRFALSREQILDYHRYYSTTKCPPSPRVCFDLTIHSRNKSTLQKSASPECRSLVLWGKNLSSSVGYGQFTKQVTKLIKLPPFQLGVVIGLILSDCSLTIKKPGGKNAQLGFGQSTAHSGYLWFVFFILSPYCISYPRATKSKRKGIQCFALQFETRSLPCLTELHSLFYVNKVKVIPQNIYELLTPVALAHWIMGDGGVRPYGLIICTDSFTVPDIVRLINILIIRYNLDCTLREEKQYNRIYIRSRSMPLLRTIVIPYMHPSMLYKLGL